MKTTLDQRAGLQGARPDHGKTWLAGPLGYTLMEMVVVITIICILIGGGIPIMMGIIDHARYVRAGADIQTIDGAVLNYRTQTAHMPKTLNELATMNLRGGAPLLEPEALVDPWEQGYRYRNPGKMNRHKHDTWSAGRDSIDSTEDDVGNWRTAKQ